MNNQYIKVPSRMVEELCKRRFPAIQTNIISVIVRYTYGYGRKTHNLSTGFIALKIGKTPSDTGRALMELKNNKVIVFSGKRGNVRVVGMNENFDEWKTPLNPHIDNTVCKHQSLNNDEEIDVRGMSVAEMMM